MAFLPQSHSTIIHLQVFLNLRITFLSNCGCLIFYFLLAFTSSLIFERTYGMLGNISHFFGRPLTFFKIIFFKKFLQEYYQSVNGLDPDQARHSVGSDLGPNCLQRSSVDDEIHCWQAKSYKGHFLCS